MTLSIGNAYDLHTRLLPHLREIATARLERRGQRPGPDTLGRWWELLRPDRPEPAERFAPGIPEARPARARRRPGARSDEPHRGRPDLERRRRRGREGGRRQARRARAAAARPARRRARAARGLPRPREDADGALVRAGLLDGLLAHPVHARPDAVRRDGLVGLQPARRRLPVPAGPDLRQPAARGRDQPRTAEDAGGAARSDAGAAGDDRGRDAPARPAVPRDRDAEPDRVRRDVSAARGAARPLPAAHVGRLSRARGRMARARRTRGAANGRGAARTRRRPRHAARDAARMRGRVRLRVRRALHGRRRRRDPQRTVDPGRRVAARLARAAEALALPRGTRRPRLRDTRRRQGDRGACARPPPHAAPGALGAADLRRGRGAGAPRDRRRHRSPRTSRARDAARDLEARRLRRAVGVRARRRARARAAGDRRAHGAVLARGRRRSRTRRLAPLHRGDRRRTSARSRATRSPSESRSSRRPPSTGSTSSSGCRPGSRSRTATRRRA